jgi:hypothetical protein
MKNITGAQGAFIVRILMEAMQSAKDAGKRLLEAGFTGQKKDKLGHTRYYQDGRQVKNPNAKEKANINAAAAKPLPAGQAPSHTDAATRVNALSTDTPQDQVKAVANDLMKMDVKDLEKMAQAPTEKKPTTAEKATSSGKQSGIGEAGDLLKLDTDTIHVDPHRFQYKQKLDSTTGAGDNLKNVNKFNPLFAGVIHAWKDPADGKIYVVNGHHRMELARRAGHKKMNVQMIEAPDAATARSTGALINMAEGRGTALDAAKFLRDSGQSIEDLKGHGVSLREKVVDNAVQLKGLSDRIFNDLSSGILDEDKAVAIGRHLKDHKEQEQLYNHYLEQREKNNKEFSASTLDQAAQDLAKAPKKQGGGQMDLFGNTDDGKSLFLEKAELKNKIRAALTQEVNDYGVAGNARRAKNIAGAGNVLQVEKNKELSKQADRVKQAFEQFQHLSGPLSDAINAHVEEYANVKGSKRAIVEKSLAAVRTAIQEIIDGGGQSNLRTGSADTQNNQGAGGAGQENLPGDLRGGNAQDVGPSLFGEPQNDEPAEPAAVSKADEPGFTGVDSEGREWRNGELVAAKDKPTGTAPTAGALNPESLALDALRLKGNRKPHNAAHITPDAVASLKQQGLIDASNRITDKGREHLYQQKGKALRKATGPKVVAPSAAPAAPTALGADADALEALRLKRNKKPYNAGHITPEAIASLKKQGLIDDANKLTTDGRVFLAVSKSRASKPNPANNPTVGGEKYFGTGGEHAVVTLKNGKKGIIPPPLENVPGWKDYEPIEAKSFYNLSESEVVEHREAQELIRREWPKFRQEYLAKMGTFDPETGELISITCNCDDWRDQFPNYVGTNSGVIHDAASYANMRMLNEAMALMKGKGNNQFLVLGGGGGSGKGTATKDIIKAGDYPVVLDSVSDDSAWTKELMDMAKGHGYGGQFVFIDRAPQDAWKDGVVKRAMESRAKFNAGDKTSLARTVPLSVAVPANLKARRAAFELLEDGQVPTMIINNNLGFGKAREVVGDEAAAYLQNGISSYNKDELLKELEDDTYGLYESGKIPDDVAKGLISAKTIETRRLQSRSTGGSDREGAPDGRGANTNSQGISNQAPLDGSTSQGNSDPGKSGQGEEVEKDFSKQQEIKNSLNQGEGIIKYGKKISGEKYSTDELNAVVKSVNSARAKLGLPGFTGIDAQGREWQNGELVAAKKDKPNPPSPRQQLLKKMGLDRRIKAAGDKLPHEMTLDEYSSIMDPYNSKWQIGQKPDEEHLEWVKAAMVHEPEKVPTSVLQMYADDDTSILNELINRNNEKSTVDKPTATATAPDEAPAPASAANPKPAKELPELARTKPNKAIIFSQPITGPSGAKLGAYQWQHKVIDDLDKVDGEKAKRVSDWEKAISNVETNKDIVHHFTITMPDGNAKTVSLESAIKLLGYEPDSDGAKQVKTIANTTKTLAKAQMQLALAQHAADENEKIKAEVAAMTPPPMTIQKGSFLGKPNPKHDSYVMGESRISLPAGDNTPPETIAAELTRTWRRDQVEKKGGDNYDTHKTLANDLQEKIKKLEKNLNAKEPEPTQPTPPPAPAPAPAAPAPDDAVARHMQRQAFTGIDAQGREWRNGELVAAKDEPTKAPAGNTDLFGNPTKAAPKGPETMPGLFGEQVPIAPDAPAAAAGEPLPGSDNPLDRPGAGRGKDDTQDMFGLFGPGTKHKIDQVNNGPDANPVTPAPAEKDDPDAYDQAANDAAKQWQTNTPAAAPEPATNKAPGVSLSDVPYDLAYNAHRGTSFVPERRAQQRQTEYVNQMQADWEHLSKFAKTPEQREILKSEFARYKAGYLAKYKAALSADSRTLSAMVTGPARFPTSRNNKANDAADKRRQETEEFRKRALFAAAKAINPVTSGAPVLSRDADAVQTLQTQLDQLMQSQELMKKMNAAYKKFLKNPASLATSGLSEKQQALIKDFHANPPERAWSKAPFPPYKLQNQSANIRRIQDRIETLSKLKAMPEKEEKYTGGVSISHDPDDARIRVRFPGKPSPEVIKKIKSKGFIWSPTNGAWQRQLNGNGTYAADELMRALGHEKITTEAIMPATDPHADKIKLVQAIIARRGVKPPQPKAQAKKTPEASCDADPRVKRIRELMDAYC